MILDIKKIYIIARYTLSELYKSRILVNTFLIGLGILLTTYVASEFSYGVPQKIALDFGVGITSLITVVISILMGVSLISKEIENRTLYMILSRPISRTTFIVGRILGMISLLITNILILNMISFSLYFYMGGVYSDLLVWTTVFSVLECSIVLSAVVFFSLITNNVLAVMNTVVLFIAGHSIATLSQLSFVKHTPELNVVVKGLSYVIPNFSKLNIKQYLIYRNSLSLEYLTSSFCYGLIYLIIIIISSTIIFNRKNLD